MRIALDLSWMGILALVFIAPASAGQFSRWDDRAEVAGGFRLIPELHLLSTSSNYDPQGKSVSGNGLKYAKNLLDLHLIGGLGGGWSLFSRLSFVTVKFETTALEGAGLGLGDQAIGLNYRLPRTHSSSPILDLQAQVDFPLYDKAKLRGGNPPDPLLGDGVREITFGPFLNIPLALSSQTRWFLLSGLGVSLRGGGFSTQVPYQLMAGFFPARSGFFGKLGLQGLRSLKQDGDTVEVDPGFDIKDAGGSLIVDALNSSYLATRLQLGYQTLERTQFWLAFQKTLAGKSTADLSSISLGVQVAFGGGRPRSLPPRQSRPSSSAAPRPTQRPVPRKSSRPGKTR